MFLNELSSYITSGALVSKDSMSCTVGQNEAFWSKLISKFDFFRVVFFDKSEGSKSIETVSIGY